MEPHTSKRASADATLGARLTRSRARSFVGRHAELDLIRELLEDDPPAVAVVFLHGPGGIGKSALLRAIADEAEDAGRITALVDGALAGRDPTTFTAALAMALGLPPDADPVTALHTGPPALLLLDTFDTLERVEVWLREQLLPALPSRTLTIIASRTPPSHGWMADPGWRELSRSIALRNLRSTDARRLLRDRGVPTADLDALVTITGGYPLGLTLLAEVAERGGTIPSTLRDVPDVVQALLQRLLEEVPTPSHREAVHVAAHALTTTTALLRDTVPESDADELFAWLRGLPFVEARLSGLAPHDVAREAIEADLRWRDPDRFREVHRRVRAHIISRLTDPDPAVQRVAFGHLMHLHRNNPLFAPYSTWHRGSLERRRASPADIDEAVRLTAGFGLPRTAAHVRGWATFQPSAVEAIAPAGGVIDGFALLLELGGDPATGGVRATPDDPVTRGVLDHLATTAPLRDGEHVLLNRVVLSRDDPLQPSPVMDAYMLAILTRSLTAPTPAVTVATIPRPEADAWEPLLTYIDWGRLPAPPVPCDGREWVLFGHDWRTVPASVWLDVMGDREIADDLDLDALRAVPPPRTQVLSREEFDEALRAALRGARRPEQLRGNPLTRSRFVLERGADDPVATLLTCLEEATDALRDHPGGDRWHRAIAATYFGGAPTQEAAAERLGLPFSTYRRHLTAGIAAITDTLWDRDLHGGPSATTAP